MSTGFPHFYYPPENGGVGRAFVVGKLSTVIPRRFPLCESWNCQKNFYPTYPRAVFLFPLGYPRFHPQPIIIVENPVEKRWINPKNRAQ